MLKKVFKGGEVFESLKVKMKKRVLFLTNFAIYLTVCCCILAGPLFAKEENPLETGISSIEKQITKDSLKKDFEKSLVNSVFVVETNEEIVAESLERISGKIDRGFSDPENTFKSVDHYKVGPFAKERVEDKKQSRSSY